MRMLEFGASEILPGISWCEARELFEEFVLETEDVSQNHGGATA